MFERVDPAQHRVLGAGQARGVGRDACPAPVGFVGHGLDFGQRKIRNVDHAVRGADDTFGGVDLDDIRSVAEQLAHEFAAGIRAIAECGAGTHVLDQMVRPAAQVAVSTGLEMAQPQVGTRGPATRCCWMASFTA